DRVERIKVTAVQLDPFVPDIVRGHRVLDREQRHDLVVFEDHLAVWADDESDVEEAPGELRMAGLRLRHQKGVPLPRELAEIVGLRARDVNRAFPRELLVVDVEDLVVESLQGAFGDGDEPHRQVQAGQPRCRLDEVREMLEVRAYLIAAPDATHGGDQAQGLIRLDHGECLQRCPWADARSRQPAWTTVAAKPDTSVRAPRLTAAPGTPGTSFAGD